MKKDLIFVLAILTVLTVLSGFGFGYVLQTDSQALQTIYLAVAYMPTPLYALMIYSLVKRENLFFKYIKNHNLRKPKIYYTVGIFLTLCITLIILTVIFSNLLPDIFHKFITTNEALYENTVKLFGEEVAQSANMPPHPLLLIPVSIVGAISAGFTLNLIFAMGEEILWRGYMWDQLKEYGIAKVSIITGLFWGLWHAPLVLQGYNYGPEQPILGAFMFIIFCIAFSFLFTLVMKRTGSTVLAAALHGMFNGFVGIFIVLIYEQNPFLDGAIGIISIFSIVVTFLIFQLIINKRFNEKPKI